MNLPIPVVGVDAGPDYALNVNACLAFIDSHNHAPGSGVQITPSGLNININLPMNQNSLTLVGSIQYFSQSSDPSSNNTGYVKNGDFYFTDGSGNHIRFTASGSIVGATGNITGLGGGAAVTYVDAQTKYVFTDNNTFPAALDSGGVIIRQIDTSGALGITLQSPNSLASNYSLTLPTALPGSNQYLTSSNAGNLSFSTADQIGSAMTSVGANSIANARTRTIASTVGVGGVAINGPSATFGTTSSSFSIVTNLSVTITTSGRPVALFVSSDGSGNPASLICNAGGGYGEILFYNSTSLSEIARFEVKSGTEAIPSLMAIAQIPAGTYLLDVQARSLGGSLFSINHCILIAYEL